MLTSRSLCNFGFATLNVFVLFAFSNLAVFFSFYGFLNQLPIPPQWHGLIIGAFSGSALIVRPIISPRLNADNAIRAITVGLGLTIASLLFYAHVDSLAPMLLLRIVHGTAYVIMMSASVTLLTIFMPAEKSGQGFAIVTVMTLLPYAVIPYVLEHGMFSMATGAIYTYTALFMLVPSGLLLLLSKHVRNIGNEMAEAQNPLSRGRLLSNLRRPKIVALLVANGLVFSVFSSMFFFLKTFCAMSGLGDPGLFFSAATGVTIATRIFFGPFFDRFDKGILAAASLLLFAGSVLMLGAGNSLAVFYTAAVLFGVGVGSASPVMNALMFLISPPQDRGLNTNLMLEMVDAGFVVGPTACGLALSAGFDFTSIWGACVAALIFSACLMGLFRNSNMVQNND